MVCALATLALLAAGPQPDPTWAEAERSAVRHLVRTFERVGRSAPTVDPALSRAARTLAERSLQTGARLASDVLAVSAAVSLAGAADPTPRVWILRAGPSVHALGLFLERRDYAHEPATHLGLATAGSSGDGILVALLVERRASLEPFPRSADPGSVHPLCGALRPPLVKPELYVTRPSGLVDRLPLTVEHGRRFCATVPLPQEGRHALEVVAHGQGGPEIVSLFHVDVGRPAPPIERAAFEEPETVPAARLALRERINSLRRAHGLMPVGADVALDEIAQAFSERMAEENFFAHVSPDGGDLRRRLGQAGYRYTVAGENIGSANGPLAAHFAIEHSPGHRKNLLGPRFTRAGIGVAFTTRDGRPQAIVTQLFVSGPPPARKPPPGTYRAVALRRAELKLPPLRRSRALEALAEEHARRALALDLPRVELAGSRLHERVFESLPGLRSASVDFFVGDDPSALPSSRGLSDGGNDRIGIGTVRGDSRTYGPGSYWVVVIYAASR